MLIQAHQKTLNVKGSSSWHCCIKCKNVLNADPSKIAGDDYLQHYSTAKLNLCDLCEDSDYWDATDILEVSKPP